MTVRAFGYLRLSKDRKDSTSIAKQRAIVDRFCTDRGWTTVDWFQDVDRRGGTTKRPGYQAMLARLDECDAIVFWRLERIMRSTVELWALYKQCQAAGVDLVSATEPYDTSTAAGRLILGNLSGIAEIEAENTSQRMKATHDHLLSLGRHVGRISYGWRMDPNTKQLIHEPGEVEIIRAMAAAVLRGEGLQQVANALEDGTLIGRRVLSPGGAERWWHQTVKDVLENPRLLGFARWRGELTSRAPILPPVLDVATFEAVQAEIRRRTRARSRPGAERQELTGLVRCGDCGAQMYRSGGSKYRTYTCSRQQGRRVSINADWLNAHVRDELFKKVDEMKLAAAERRRLDDTPAPDQELRATIARLEWGRDELLRDYYQEARLNRTAFETQLQEVDDRLAVLESKLEDTRVDATLGTLLEDLGDLSTIWHEFKTPQRRTIFAAAINRIVIAPARGRGYRPTDARVDIDWKKPT